MRVGFATVDWSQSIVDRHGLPALGGSGHIRIGQYLPYLQGIDYAIGSPVFDADKGLFGIQSVENLNRDEDGLIDTKDQESNCDFNFDVIYTQRNMHYMGAQCITEARANGQIIINDVDDWFWGIDPSNAAYKVTDPKFNPKYNRDSYKEALKVSSAVVASTPFLLEAISSWNPRTYMLQNHIEIGKYKQRIHGDSAALVGWVGATAHHGDDLQLLKPFARMFDWVHGGSASWVRSFASETGAHNVVELPMCTASEYPSLLQFDVGVVPLTNTDFNAAKSFLKGAEYAAAGIPFISSDLPEYRRLQSEYSIGMIAKDTKDWVKFIKRLLGSSALRSEMAESNYDNVLMLDVAFGAMALQEFLEGTH